GVEKCPDSSGVAPRQPGPGRAADLVHRVDQPLPTQNLQGEVQPVVVGLEQRPETPRRHTGLPLPEDPLAEVGGVEDARAVDRVEVNLLSKALVLEGAAVRVQHVSPAREAGHRPPLERVENLVPASPPPGAVHSSHSWIRRSYRTTSTSLRTACKCDQPWD